MLKGILVFAGLLAVATTASLYASVVEDAVCQSETEMWGGEDLRVFYFCLDGAVVLDNCPRNRYFIKNATAFGCLPAARINPNCTNTVNLEPCTGKNLEQPQYSSNPGNFYLCTEEGANPVELPCPDGKAFLNKDGYLGCFDWSFWRKIRQCQ